MSTVKDLIVKLIHKRDADKVVKKYHYSGKVTQNSQLSFGIFLKSELLGAIQFGPSIDKRRMGQSLGIGMNESLELNRLAISDRLGKNTEPRTLAICLRIIKKKYPFIKCIISFADACQCGDGTIYRASGFKLHSYKTNKSLVMLTKNDRKVISKYIKINGNIIAKKSLDDHVDSNGKYLSSLLTDSKPLPGYQMKYIYYFDKKLEKLHSSISFDKIPDEVRMYKGKKYTPVEHDDNASNDQLEESGSTPTSRLQSISQGVDSCNL